MHLGICSAAANYFKGLFKDARKTDLQDFLNT